MKNLCIKVIPILFFLLTLATSLLDSQPKWKGKIVYEDGVKVVKNTAEPLYGNWKFEIEKGIVIGEKGEESSLFLRPRDVKIDGQRNIYILDPRAYQIHKFSKEGKYLMSMGRKGEGPGEFVQASDFYVDLEGNVYVFDISGYKLTIFDSRGKFLKQIKIGKFVDDFTVGNKGRIFGLISNWDESGAYLLLCEIFENGNIGKAIVKGADSVSIWENWSFSHPYLFSPFFSLLNKDILVYGHSSEFKFYLFDTNGKLTLKIEKEEKRVPISNEEKNEILSYFKNTPPEIKKHIDFAPYRPFFNSIFTDDMGRIYVKRMKSVLDESKNTDFDIFSEEGKYLYRATLAFNPELISNGFIYDLRFEEERGKYIITRYIVKNWKEFRNR